MNQYIVYLRLFALALYAGSNILLNNSFASQDFDLTQFNTANTQSRRLARPPTVTWVSADAACPSDLGNRQVFRWSQSGCALREPDQQRCTLYTSKRTTHSILGHLVRFCFEGQS
jgi:hypothetical protein